MGKEKERSPSRTIEYIDPSSGKEVAELQIAVGWKGRLGNHHYTLDLPLDSSFGLYYLLLTEFGHQIFCLSPDSCFYTTAQRPAALLEPSLLDPSLWPL